jgi:rod shape-determining protein MreD
MSRLLPDIVDTVVPSWGVAAIPTISVMVCSMLTALPFIADAPLLPPFGLLLFLAWRLMRSDIWPVWIGIPLGFWDDLLSGQPIGSAVALWTAIMLAMDLLDRRVVWRDFRIDWLIGGAALFFVIVGSALLTRTLSPIAAVQLVLPQILWSWLLLPLAMLLVARLDTWRLRA